MGNFFCFEEQLPLAAGDNVNVEMDSPPELKMQNPNRPNFSGTYDRL